MISTPRFLAAQRSAVSSRREEVAQRKPFKRVFSGLFRKQKDCGPFEIPGVPDLQCPPSRASLRILEALSFWHASTYWHVKSLTILLPSSKFGRLVRRKAFLLCKNALRAGCNGGRETSSQRTQPRAKKFSEKICFAPSWVYQVCRTPRLESTQKYVSTLDS